MNNASLENILNQAMMDEVRAKDTYRKILESFDPVRPFINYRRSRAAAY
jgi:hypothetical protein